MIIRANADIERSSCFAAKNKASCSVAVSRTPSILCNRNRLAVSLIILRVYDNRNYSSTILTERNAVANREYSLDRLVEIRIRLETTAFALRQAARISLDAPVRAGFTKEIDDLARQVEWLGDEMTLEITSRSVS